ncbi:hypothetical protein F7731_16765 [Cytobacillus depressus]|uniref:Uncharacterized protein n=1 Tax=Cytobacillus depressus TaxID=1602942 RepID=A0A6L3V232_9BACI|nr:hypothetical protein [Cytobacillus depressus]KAB2332226.1 hypothetical protein F7731_16765 [Cytobacillus depressus]
MSKSTYHCCINEDVLEKFNLALLLNKEDAGDVLEKYMRQYISYSFSKASEIYKTSTVLQNTRVNGEANSDTGKAIFRIPRWAKKSNQYNHKIVRAYFQIESELGYVPLNALEKRCSDEINHSDTYVRDFRGNFNQMKIDSPKSHGKVFEIENENVIVWGYIKEILMEYKEDFCK